MKTTHKNGSGEVAFDSLGIGEVVRDRRGNYGMVVCHEYAGINGMLWLDSGVVVFDIAGDALFEAGSAELVVYDGGD